MQTIRSAAKAGIGLRNFGQARLARSKTGLVEATGSLPRTAAGRDRSTNPIRLKTNADRHAAISGIGLWPLAQTRLARSEAGFADAARTFTIAAARRHRLTNSTRFRTYGVVSTANAGIRLWDLHQACLAGPKVSLKRTAGTLPAAAARCQSNAVAIRLNPKADGSVAIARIFLPPFDETGLALSEAGLTNAAGALAIATTRLNRHAFPIRLDFGRVPSATNAGVRFWNFYEPWLAGTKVGLKCTARTLIVAATVLRQ